jgi:hypothetical protein
LQFALGDATNREKKQKTRDWYLRKERLFIETAKEMIDDTLYQKIWDAVSIKLSSLDFFDK